MAVKGSFEFSEAGRFPLGNVLSRHFWYMEMNEDFFVIGEIVNTQGIKGEMRVIPHTDDITRFEELDFVYIDLRGKIQKYNIVSVRYHKQFVLIKIEGVNDMTTAETFKGGILKVTRDMAIPLEEGEYYVKDLYGMRVISDEGEELGNISEVLFTGANDVYTVSKEGAKDILIPAIKECILNVDTDKKEMKVHLLEGLRD